MFINPTTVRRKIFHHAERCRHRTMIHKVLQGMGIVITTVRHACRAITKPITSFVRCVGCFELRVGTSGFAFQSGWWVWFVARRQSAISQYRARSKGIRFAALTWIVSTPRDNTAVCNPRQGRKGCSRCTRLGITTQCTAATLGRILLGQFFVCF